ASSRPCADRATASRPNRKKIKAEATTFMASSYQSCFLSMSSSSNDRLKYHITKNDNSIAEMGPNIIQRTYLIALIMKELTIVLKARTNDASSSIALIINNR